eukprot:1160217-Pelagomonas_calceolata.AAC.6
MASFTGARTHTYMADLTYRGLAKTAMTWEEVGRARGLSPSLSLFPKSGRGHGCSVGHIVHGSSPGYLFDYSSNKRKKTTQAEEFFPTSIKEKETLAQKSRESPPPPRWKTITSGDLDIGGTRPQNMAARSITFINSTFSGNKLVGILYRMGIKSVSKFNGTLVVKSQLFRLVECMFCVTRSTSTQENGMKSYDFCTNEFAEVCMLPLCRLQLLSRPRAAEGMLLALGGMSVACLRSCTTATKSGSEEV